MPKYLQSPDADAHALVPVDDQPAWSSESFADDSDSVLRERLEAIRRHVGKIALFVAVCTLLTGIYVLRLPKLYDGVTVLRVNPTAPQNIVGQNQAQPVVDNTTLMATEQDEIKNPDVVIPVITGLHLDQDPSINPPGSPTKTEFTVAGVSQSLLNHVLSGLTVTRSPNTFLLDISFRAHTPELAASIANAVADSMIKHEYETRSESLHSSSQYLTVQVEELRARMEQSQKALTDYERANSILSPDDKFNLLNQRLSTVATDLDKQRSTDRQLQAELALAKANDVDAILVSDRGDSLRPVMDAFHAEQLNFAAIAAKYGSADPTYKEEQRRLAGYQIAINAAMQHLATQIQAEADAQQVQTNLAQAAYDRQKLELENFNANAAQYDMLKQQADTEAKLYDDMLQRIQEADVTAGYHADTLRVVGAALPNPKVAYPQVGLSVLAAFLLSLVLAVSGVFVISSLDRTLTDPASVLAGTGERLVGSLPMEPKPERLHALWQPAAAIAKSGLAAVERNSSYAEAVFTLRTSLFLGSESPIASLAVTSAQPRDGKTTTTVSLAAASARNGVPTVLVNADLRRPEVHRALGLSNRFGLTSLFQKEISLDDVLVSTALPNLWVLPAGPAVGNSTELLTANIGSLIEELKNRYKMVFVDCPPALGFADSMIIGPTVDAVLVVARAASTPREYVRAALDQLRRVRANVAGVVLNGVSAQMNQYYRYYHYYSHYYSRDEKAVKARAGR